MFMISLKRAPKSTLKHIQLCTVMPRSTNSLATVTCNEESLEMLAYVLFILVWMCKHSYIFGCFVEIHPWFGYNILWVVKYCDDIFSLTLLNSPGGSGPSEGRALSLKWIMFLAEAKTSNCKPGLLSLSGYATYAGWPPHTNTEYCAVIWGSKFFCCLQINTQTNKHPFRACAHKGQVVLLHPATRGCRQCAPITPGFNPRFL